MDINSCKKLNNGVEIPYFGLGVFRSEAETESAVVCALQAGYRHIDTAAIYGNEEQVGSAIRKSGVSRKDIFITTKLWNQDMRDSRQQEAIDTSLARLGLDYVDLYLIHWPVKGKFVESYLEMEAMYAAGKTRAIGVSNFHEHHLAELLPHVKVIPQLNQVECHPALSHESLRAHCEKLGIAFEAWSPLGGGKSTLLTDPQLAEIGARYGKSAAQVMIRWDLQRDIITIPKSVTPERIRQNADVFDFELSEQDMGTINAMNRDQRFGADPDNFHF